MKSRPVFLAKIGITISVLLVTIFIIPLNDSMNVVVAFFTLVMSGILLYKSRNNTLMTLIAFFILYSNYSIVVGEYLVGGELGVPFYEMKTPEYYGMAIKILFVFMFIVTLFYEDRQINATHCYLEPRNNLLIFIVLVILLLYILVFEVDRSPRLVYSVRISPMYEYSGLVFLLAFYYSKASFFSNTLLIGLASVFIVQDMIFGGRITSLQLMIFLATTIFVHKLSFRRILIGGFAGIFLNSVVGVYRSSYTLTRSLKDIFVDLLSGYLVFDTPVYAYFASVTHIAASKVASSNVRYTSLWSFVKSIVFGSNEISANVTSLVARDYFWNLGGGLMPTHFFFWLGWIGVVIIACIVVCVLNRIGSHGSSDLLVLITMAITVYSPRWYLYSPLAFVRGPFVFVPLMYMLLGIGDMIIRKSDVTKGIPH